jgi:hypothetical protein
MSQQDHADALREGLARFMKSRRFTPTGWCKRAGITEGTLRSFLAGRSQTLTHATLAALAYAAHEPITALLSGHSVLGNTEVINVSVEVTATERPGNTFWLGDEQKYQLRLPSLSPKVTKFAAAITDESANEKWAQGSFIVCTEFGWDNDLDILCEGDFVIVGEQRRDFVEASVVENVRCTIRQLVSDCGEDYLVLRSRSPRFRDSIHLHTPIIGSTAVEPIATGLGTQITLLGKVLASYTLENAAKTTLCKAIGT